jgi:aldehyde dehydrogenase (NAD+)
LTSYLEKDKILSGGTTDNASLYIEPTILHKADWDDKIMQEEIFGPLLPVIEYENINSLITKLKVMERPLALYFFSNNKSLHKHIIESLHFGGGCINATLMHNGNIQLPFGGVGNSGMGRYHGKSGFDSFSYQKSIYKKPTGLDPSLIYPPYKQKVNLLRKIS